MTTRYRTPKQHEYTLEVEHGRSTVEYLVLFTVDPGEKGSPRSFDCGGTPDIPPGVDDFEVFYERIDRKTGKRVLERRPELDELVSEDALLDSWGGEGDGRDWDSERKARIEG